MKRLGRDSPYRGKRNSRPRPEPFKGYPHLGLFWDIRRWSRGSSYPRRLLGR